MINSKSRKLDGKVALVSGGASGIGLATAQRFVSEGAYVFITGRRQTSLDEAVPARMRAAVEHVRHPICRTAGPAIALSVALLAPTAARAEDVAYPSAVYDHESTSLVVSATGENGDAYENYWSGSSWLWRPLGTPPGVRLIGNSSAVELGGVVASDPLFDAYIEFFSNDDHGNLWSAYDAGPSRVWVNEGTPGVSIFGSSAVYVPLPVYRTNMDFVTGSDGKLYSGYVHAASWVWQHHGNPPGTVTR